MTALGRPRLHIRSIDSTNARARTLAAGGAGHGALVTAAEQTAGRGRQGRRWAAPAGQALLFSVVLREWPRLLSLAVAVAVAEAVGDGARIKWPNDVLVDRRKVAGILVEGRPQEGWAVLGVGINVAVELDSLPEDVRARAGTLGLEPADVEHVLARVLDALERWLAAGDDDVLAAWRRRDALAGHEVSWDGGSGRAEGVDADGRLVVALGDGSTTALDAGEVHLGVG